VNNVTKYHLYFANPFILNGVTWLFVWLLYNLGWSRLFPPLSEELTFFVIFTSIVSICIGVATLKKHTISFRPLKNPKHKPLVIWLVIFYLLFLIEAAVAGTVPLIGYATGNVTIEYSEFGLPFIHVIIVNGISALCTYATYCLKSTSVKKDKFKFLVICVSTFVPFILMFNRGGIIANIIGILILSLVTSKRPIRLLLKCMISLIALLFLFGLAGNIRFGKSGMEKFAQVAKPSDTFTETHIPPEFLWSYIYIASPLANTQNTITNSNWSQSDSEDAQNFVIYECTPEIISKRIAGEQDESNFANRAILISSSFTVASIYGRAYNYLGWTGLWLLFIFLLIFITINIKIIKKSSNYYFPMIVSVDIIVVLNIFDNMLTFMGLVPQVFIFFLLYLFSRLRKQNIRNFSN
jgi:hypothetical protein